MLNARDICKSFDGKQVLRDVTLSLEEGHIFGLLGTNGAGKSTLLRVLSGIYTPDAGTVSLDGAPVFENEAAKSALCYLSDDPAFLHAATVADMGRFQAAWCPGHDAGRLAELCERFALPMNERVDRMSKGTQKRAQICLGLARQPKVLLCDETFDGLDPVMRESFRRALTEETVDRGLITVLAGHNQQEMEDICDRVGFLHEGRLITVGDLDAVVSGLQKIQLATAEPLTNEELAPLRPLKVQRQGRLSVLILRGGEAECFAALQAFRPQFMEKLPLSLEEVFILEMEAQGYAN